MTDVQRYRYGKRVGLEWTYSDMVLAADYDLLAADNAALQEAAFWFGEVMAVMHCDGGEYLAEHGPKKAAEDAIAKRTALIIRLDSAEAEIERLRELLREWQRVYSTRSNIYYATDAALKGEKP